MIVDFINGDPDRPMVLGSLYNNVTMPPWDLPENATQSGLVSRTIGGGRTNFNGIQFDDKPGEEYYWEQAERDMSRLTKRNEDQVIGENSTTKIGLTRSTFVGTDDTTNVVGNQSLLVGANQSTNVVGNNSLLVGIGLAIQVGASQSEIIGGAKGINVGGAFATNVGGAYTLAVGGPWLRMLVGHTIWLLVDLIPMPLVARIR
ncbi:hypothetical protein BG55_04195 [Erwinia mallotivora]|uniref:Gp5/Type VI secretion system Vgr C-terminal trimerisation domain-containing protein n=1 Tax=Erwinia mallotivora TaxID=69222 RepID=A0A014NRX9_9GAMM|nr:hypothetical protein BG55_04195 [Erwinia mallotivora]